VRLATYLTPFVTAQGPELPIAGVFEAAAVADFLDRDSALALSQDFAGRLNQIDGIGVTTPVLANGAAVEHGAGADSVLAMVPVEPETPHFAQAWFDNPYFSDEIAAKYVLIPPVSAIEQQLNQQTRLAAGIGSGATAFDATAATSVPAAVVAEHNDVGQMFCFLANRLGQPIDEAGAVVEFEKRIVLASGESGYVTVPEGRHAVCEQIAQTALLSVRNIVLDLQRQAQGSEYTANWTVRVTALLPSGESEIEFEFDGRGRDWDVEGAVPEYIKIRPGIHYAVELVKPSDASVFGHYDLVGLYESRAAGNPDHSDSAPWQNVLADLAASAEVAEQPPTARRMVAGARGQQLTTSYRWTTSTVVQPLEIIEVTFVSQAVPERLTVNDYETDIRRYGDPTIIRLPAQIMRLTQTGSDWLILLVGTGLVAFGITTLVSRSRKKAERA